MWPTSWEMVSASVLASIGSVVLAKSEYTKAGWKYWWWVGGTVPAEPNWSTTSRFAMPTREPQWKIGPSVITAEVP